MVTVKNLSYSYNDNGGKAVDGISFEISRGEIFGFLGPNGAGKSTTQKILIGLLKGYKGSASVLESEIRKTEREYYEQIGVAFEFPNLYSKFTGLENLLFFQSLYRGPKADPMKLLKQVGLEKDAGMKAGSYSKGMKMRLNFARALINNPEMVFLDEPTAGLDPVNARIMKNMILDLKSAGKTVFLTTHNMIAAEELCDRVAFIVDGTISLIDSPRNLKIKFGQPFVKAETFVSGEHRTREFPLPDLGSNPEFFSFIQSGNLETIHSQEASLEDIFIKATGRALI